MGKHPLVCEGGRRRHFIIKKRRTIAKPRYEFYVPRVLAAKISNGGVNAAVLQLPAK